MDLSLPWETSCLGSQGFVTVQEVQKGLFMTTKGVISLFTKDVVFVVFLSKNSCSGAAVPRICNNEHGEFLLVKFRSQDTHLASSTIL